MSESTIPTAMMWRFKTIRKLLKETVPMTPKPWSKQEVVDAFMSALKLESRVA